MVRRRAAAYGGRSLHACMQPCTLDGLFAACFGASCAVNEVASDVQMTMKGEAPATAAAPSVCGGEVTTLLLCMLGLGPTRKVPAHGI